MDFFVEKTCRCAKPVQTPHDRKVLLSFELHHLSTSFRFPPQLGQREQTVEHEMNTVIGQVEPSSHRIKKQFKVGEKPRIIDTTSVICVAIDQIQGLR
jgi:hypothetical protein